MHQNEAIRLFLHGFLSFGYLVLTPLLAYKFFYGNCISSLTYAISASLACFFSQFWALHRSSTAVPSIGSRSWCLGSCTAGILRRFNQTHLLEYFRGLFGVSRGVILFFKVLISVILVLVSTSSSALEDIVIDFYVARRSLFGILSKVNEFVASYLICFWGIKRGVIFFDESKWGNVQSFLLAENFDLISLACILMLNRFEK